ncbi:hypothetical protein [Changpingibacter yushuensis]|uniref:hypothetical protein n=1 Tax=Changpingibacter yushuensis TaxID=2758440 RepID=UPI0015F5EC5E|nr:hypothetical protein [Changpingibacter yushuensis]
MAFAAWGFALAFLSVFGAQRAFASELTWIDVPTGTQSIWVDLEGSTLNPNEVAGSLHGQEGSIDLSFVASPAGLTATTTSSSAKVALELETTTKANARVALTFADGKGNVLAETNSLVTLLPDEVTPVEPSPDAPATVNPSPAEPGTSTDATSKSGVLANTGVTVGAVVLLALALIGVGMAFIRTQRAGAESK